MKRLLAMLGIFGRGGDSFEARVERRLAEPSQRNDFATAIPAARSQRVVPLLVAAATFAAVGQTLAAGSLIDKFRAPDPESRPEAWWHWVGSYATK